MPYYRYHPGPCITTLHHLISKYVVLFIIAFVDLLKLVFKVHSNQLVTRMDTRMSGLSVTLRTSKDSSILPLHKSRESGRQIPGAAIYGRSSADTVKTKMTGRLAWLLWRPAYFTMTLSIRNKILVPTYCSASNFTHSQPD
ncbi:hypothetical protein BDR03DRAFT_1011668 [Suillus americanus]|nr:hypothetical protein BDR03DRAFT_1011668 [Suillus americanus]